MQAFTYPDWSTLPLFYTLVIGWIVLLLAAAVLEVTTYAVAHHPLGAHRREARGA